MGAIMMALGVALGAFGAHALKKMLDEQMLEVYQTGVLYHFIHALGIFVVAFALYIKPSASSQLIISGYLMLGSIFIFSGSLYLLSITGIKWLGAITPIGGVWIYCSVGVIDICYLMKVVVG